MFFYPVRHPYIQFKGVQEYVDQLSSLIVVVPSGLGKRHFLDRLLASLSLSVWLSLLAAVLVVAAAQAALGGGLARALTAAFAALLEQPVAAGRTPRRRRPVQGGWLLASLVLSAAYKGQLLGMLTVSQRAEIDSVDELLASNLTIFAPRRLGPYRSVLLPDFPEGRLRFRSSQSFGGPWTDLLVSRNCALLLLYTAEPMLASWLAEPSPIHLLRVPGARVLFSSFATRTGSPLWDAAVKTFGHLIASGVMQSWRSGFKARKLRDAALDRWGWDLPCPGTGCPEAGGPQSLSLANVAPAGAVLGLGLCVAATAFLAELLMGSQRPPCRPRSRGWGEGRGILGIRALPEA